MAGESDKLRSEFSGEKTSSDLTLESPPDYPSFIRNI